MTIDKTLAVGSRCSRRAVFIFMISANSLLKLRDFCYDIRNVAYKLSIRLPVVGVNVVWAARPCREPREGCKKLLGYMLCSK